MDYVTGNQSEIRLHSIDPTYEESQDFLRSISAMLLSSFPRAESGQRHH